MTNTIKLTGNETIKVGDKEVKLADIDEMEIIDNYRINKVKFKSNRGERKWKHHLTIYILEKKGQLQFVVEQDSTLQRKKPK